MITNIPFVLLFWLGNLVSKTYHLTTGTDTFKRISFVFSHFSYVFKRPFPSFAPIDLLVGVAVAGALKLFVYLRGKNKKIYRNGEEHGSARFGTSADIQPFIDSKNPENNILLS